MQPRNGAASCSVKGAGGGRYKCFRAAFPHNFFLTTGYQIVFETYKNFTKVDNN